MLFGASHTVGRGLVDETIKRTITVMKQQKEKDMKNKTGQTMLYFLAAVLIFGTAAGCSKKTETPKMREIMNGDGTALQVPYKVERVAALFGPSYEKVMMLGAEDKIVACSNSHKKL